MAQHDFVPAWLNFSTPQPAKVRVRVRACACACARGRFDLQNQDEIIACLFSRPVGVFCACVRVVSCMQAGYLSAHILLVEASVAELLSGHLWSNYTSIRKPVTSTAS